MWLLRHAGSVLSSSAQHPDALVPVWLQKDTLRVRRGMSLCSIKQLDASQLSASLSALARNPD